MEKGQKNEILIQLDEIISPIFGNDYHNRIISRKDEVKNLNQDHNNALEHHIEKELQLKQQIDSNHKYQTKAPTNSDVIAQYQQNKSHQEIIERLPSNYLDFRDNFGQNPDKDLTIVQESGIDNTISQIVNDIFEHEPHE